MARRTGIAEATLRLRVKRDGLAAVQTEIDTRMAQQEQSDADDQLRLMAEQVMYQTIDRLEPEVERLESANAMLRKRVTELEAENAKLRRRR
jgi:predicted RNase H-like nuclease (RuvC/YqgF family)